MARPIAHYGWNPDLPDVRDHLFAAPPPVLAKLPPKVDLRDECPPVYDQGQLGSCFPAGTRIRMADGSQRRIEDVRLGELVVTAERRVGMVHQTMLRLEREALVKLSLWGYSALRMTREHPVLTRRGYIPAGELRLDDFVALPRYRPAEERTTLDVTALLSRTERTIKAGVRKMGVLHGRADVAVRVASLPERIDLSPRFGRLVGLFLAEGSTDSGKVRWTFGAHEAETLVAETVDLLTDLEVEGYVQHRPNNSINVVVYGTAWARLWERLCGNGSGRKSLHPLLFAGSDAFLREVLEGWLAGDGYAARKDGRTYRSVGSTVSDDLGLAMFDIAQHLGLRPVLRRERGKRNRHAAHRRDVRFVEVHRDGSQDNWRSEMTETHVWRKVRAVEEEPFAGHVYNLSVEGDESYVAEGVGVHNCTANAIGGALEFDQMKQGEQPFTPSRLFIYYCEREVEGTIESDSGAQIRDGIKCVNREGAPPEDDWPYDIAKFKERPPQKAYDDARLHEALSYQRIPRSLNQLKGCLAAGYPFVFGIRVYESFESQEVASTGEVPMPSAGEQALGGHAIMAVGYDDAQGRLVVRNSWGDGWGMKGYFTLPYAYAAERGLASDFWTIRTVS